jgi:predicted phage-related endonuclease
MTITMHREMLQGTDEWLAARCGILTASELRLIVTPTFRASTSATRRAHLFDLVAQRITGHVEPRYITDDMLRGMNDEGEARALYERHHGQVEQIGFITRAFDHGGVRFTLGYSPDGLVGDDGAIEIKSRRAKFQIETILEGEMPEDYAVQVQAGLLISGREWCDFVSYSGGLPLFVRRVERDPRCSAAILDACAAAEEDMARMAEDFARLARGMVPTERRVEEGMLL